MLALDTNILARLLLADDAKQLAQARKLLSQDEQFTAPITVMLELVWVLESYELNAQDISAALLKLLGLPNFKPAHGRELRSALTLYQQGLDFTDALHWQFTSDKQRFVTMNRKLVSKAQALLPEDIHPPISIYQALNEPR